MEQYAIGNIQCLPFCAALTLRLTFLLLFLYAGDLMGAFCSRPCREPLSLLASSFLPMALPRRARRRRRPASATAAGPPFGQRAHWAPSSPTATAFSKWTSPLPPRQRGAPAGGPVSRHLSTTSRESWGGGLCWATRAPASSSLSNASPGERRCFSLSPPPHALGVSDAWGAAGPDPSESTWRLRRQWQWDPRLWS